jgi:hypothetical protein
MSDIKNLLESALAANAAYEKADEARDAAFDALKQGLKDRFSLYGKLFRPLAHRAKSLGCSFPEFRNDNEFYIGNGRLVAHLTKDDFLYVEGEDHRYCSTDTFISYLPKKYLSEGWEEKMREDAQRIDVELVAIEKEQNEQSERQEYERLKKIFG